MIKIAVFGYSRETYSGINTLKKLGYTLSLFLPKNKKNKRDPRIDTLNLPLTLYDNINETPLYKTLSDFQPDYIFCIVLEDKIPPSITKLATHKSLNFHPSKLPAYRSANPWFWVIRNQETTSAITIHQLKEKWDSGDILLQHPISLHKYETNGSYIAIINKNIPMVIQKLHPYFQSHKWTATPQTKSTYYPKITEKDLHIDWTQSGASIDALIRACNPYTPAKTFFKGLSVFIFEVSITTLSATKPGKITYKKDQLLVSCKDMQLSIGIVSIGPYGYFSGYRFGHYLGITDTSQFDI